MKFIKKYETFTNDESRTNITEEPKYNPVNNLKAKNYVELVFSKGAGDEVNQICKEIGCEMPSSEEELDKSKEEAIKYFIENPERMKSFDQPISKIQQTGDASPRTNNIGGTSFSNSTHVGESFQSPSSDGVIEINKDEMKLFGTETQLIKLIRTNKISLHDNEVWFDENDEETKKILDIFFEINQVNESVAGIVLGVFSAIQLIKLLLKLLASNLRHRGTKKLIDVLKMLSVAMTNDKGKFVNVVSVSEFSDKYFITCKKTILGYLPDIRILKNEKIMIFDDFEIKLSDKEYEEFSNIIKHI